jgi:hypothetical protein
VQYVRITLLDLRGRAAVAAAAVTTGGEQRRWIADAQRSAARLARETAGWASPLAVAIRAGVASVRNETETATELLTTAITGFERVEMTFHAELGRLVLGLRAPGSAGEAHRRTAHAWMAREAVVAPERLAAVIAPGLLP